MRLRGYMVSGPDATEGALLIFDHTARDAKRRGYHTILYDFETAWEFTEVRVRWLRDADPKEWGVTESCVLEPEGCDRCELWHGKPVNKETGICQDCQDFEDEDDEKWKDTS